MSPPAGATKEDGCPSGAMTRRFGRSVRFEYDFQIAVAAPLGSFVLEDGSELRQLVDLETEAGERYRNGYLVRHRAGPTRRLPRGDGRLGRLLSRAHHPPADRDSAISELQATSPG
jgi:hypothetical protein